MSMGTAIHRSAFIAISCNTSLDWNQRIVPQIQSACSGQRTHYAPSMASHTRLQCLLPLQHDLKLPARSARFRLCFATSSKGLVSLTRPVSLSEVSTSAQTKRDPALWCLRKEFERIVEGLSDALDFSRTIGVDGGNASYELGGGRGALRDVDFYTRCVLSNPFCFC